MGFLAWHVADAHPSVLALAKAVADGYPPPPTTPATPEALARVNAEKLAQHAAVTKTEARDRLRANGAAVATAIRALSDAQLDHTETLAMMGGTAISAQQLIETGLIGHARSHLASMQATADAQR